MRLIINIGRYFEFMCSVFTKPVRIKIFRKRLLEEIEKIGIDSIGIVALVSIFMGAVLVMQVATNFESPIIPKYVVGVTIRDTMIIEFSSTVICLILSGKVGSNIASEIGTMRITEQIDALEIMGINSAGYLILPKLVAALITFPLLCLLSIILGIAGGYLIALFTQITSVSDLIYGLHYAFRPYYVTYTIIKMCVNSFIITSIASFYGYYVSGGALEIGKSSTQAVVHSIVIVLLSDLILTHILLT